MLGIGQIENRLSDLFRSTDTAQHCPVTQVFDQLVVGSRSCMTSPQTITEHLRIQRTW
jgi:hypothetical protein